MLPCFERTSSMPLLQAAGTVCGINWMNAILRFLPVAAFARPIDEDRTSGPAILTPSAAVPRATDFRKSRLSLRCGRSVGIVMTTSLCNRHWPFNRLTERIRTHLSVFWSTSRKPEAQNASCTRSQYIRHRFPLFARRANLKQLMHIQCRHMVSGLARLGPKVHIAVDRVAVDFVELVAAEAQTIERAYAVVDLLRPACSDQCRRDARIPQYPGQRHLRQCLPASVGDGRQGAHAIHDLGVEKMGG